MRLPASLVLIAGLIAPQHVSLGQVDCTTVVTEGYDSILNRKPDDGGLKDKVKSCEEETRWPASAGPMAGKPWSPAGMVYEMRNSEE
jgi:hypothetical protein